MTRELWGCIIQNPPGMDVQTLNNACLINIKWLNDTDIDSATLDLNPSTKCYGTLGQASGSYQNISNGGYFEINFTGADVSGVTQRPSKIVLNGGQIQKVEKIQFYPKPRPRVLHNVTVVNTKVIEGGLTGLMNSDRNNLSNHLVLNKI